MVSHMLASFVFALLFFLFLFCFVATSVSAQDLLLGLRLGVAPGRAQRIIPGARDQTCVGHMQGKHPIFCSISLTRIRKIFTCKFYW